MPKKRGRKTLLTPERIENICELVSAGNNLETAAAANGVGKSAFHNWMSRGRAEQDRIANNPRATKPRASEQIFVDLVEHIEKARAQADARLVLLIHRAAQEPKTWQAAAWLLERRDPKQWGRTSRENAQQDANNDKQEGVIQAVDKMVQTPPLPVVEE